MAPNMTLALEVLRMATLELQVFLRQQAQENPLLEVDEPVQTDDSAATAPDGSSLEETAPAPLTGNEDWLTQWRQSGGASEAEEPEDDQSWLTDQRMVQPQSLHESLLTQLHCHPISGEERRIGETLVQSLNEYGYLEGPLEEIAAYLQTALPQVEAVLNIIQRMDPPGVGARDLRECLMIQLEQRSACESLAYRILRDHFPLFVQHRLQAIAGATAATVQEVDAACACLIHLNPKPGRMFTSDLPSSIIPDLVVSRRERHYDVELNDQGMPTVSISRAYHRMLKDARTPEEAREFLLKKFRQASWVIKSIDERNATVLAIGRCLLSLQREFIEHGPKALKPLTQAQVAQSIGRHPSTVSRAIAGKTMDTPYGVFRLEEMFASGVPQRAQTDNVSDAAIKSEIVRLVTEEDKSRPLSDEALVQRLRQRSITVARRTIAKYRTTLKILPGHLRRRRA